MQIKLPTKLKPQKIVSKDCSLRIPKNISYFLTIVSSQFDRKLKFAAMHT